MAIFSTILAAILSYLIGSVPFAYITGRILKGIDIRNYGSGNVGASNVLRVLGKGPGISVLLLDIGKGLLIILVVPLIFYKADFPIKMEIFKVICALCAVAGHNWTVFLNFRGGKGVAITIGIFFALAPIAALFAMCLFLIVASISRYISLSSMVSSVSLPIFMALFRSPIEYLFLGILLALLIIFMHGSNIGRLLKGTERKIGEKLVIPEEKE